jgi:SpoVK/Ycf46/Vps4 family AAA+-type ATPase
LAIIALSKGADLQALSKEAGMRALRRVLPEIDLSSESHVRSFCILAYSGKF